MTSIFPRYLIKLAKNIVTTVIGLISVIILPRSLGPADYGNLHFIRKSFETLFGFIDLNASTAYFVYSSKNENSNNFTQFHIIYCLIIGAIMFLFISVLATTGILQIMFPDQELLYVYLGLILGYSVYLFINLTNLSDSKELTVGFEKRNISIMLISLILLLVLYFAGIINLFYIFGYYIIINLLLIIISIKYLKANGVLNFNFRDFYFSKLKGIIRYYYNFSSPLFVASIFTFFILFFERWFLQTIGGSVEQGFFNLAFRVGAISIIITDAMSQIYQQTISKAHGQNNLKDIRDNLEKINIFYCISAVIAVFFSSIPKNSLT